MRTPTLTTLALIALGVALAGAARADGFADRLAPELHDRLIADQPAADAHGDRLLLLDDLVLGPDAAAGDVAALGAHARAWLQPTDGRKPRGTSSRYRSPTDPAFRGDGRVEATGVTLPGRGRRRDVQVQGRPTTLAPAGLEGRGGLSLEQALHGLTFSRYLEAEGIPATRSFAIGLRASGEATRMRAGVFERFGHGLEVEDDPRALRALLDDLGTTLGAEAGRATGPTTYAGLYRGLLQHKAREQAAIFWARMAHGAPTYDNIGFFDVLDLDDAATVATNHVGLAPSGKGPGFGQEGPFILGRLYTGELRAFMSKAARTEDERRSLRVGKSEEDAGTYWEDVSRDTYVAAMGSHLLGHLGLDAGLARSIQRRAKGDVRQLVAVFMALAQARGDDPAAPAKYDLFRALSRVFAVHAQLTGGRGDAAARRAALDTLTREIAGPDADEDARADVEALYDAATPVMERALAGTTGHVRIARARIFAAEAARVNAPVALDAATMKTLTRRWADALRRGEDGDRVLAELHGVVRAQVRHGAQAPGEVARRLRQGKVARTTDGKLRLAVHVDPLVRIDELSDGATESLRVTFSGKGGLRPRAVVARAAGHEVGRADATTGTLDVAVDGGVLPAELTLDVEDQAGRGHSFAFAPVAASPQVDGELGIHAARHGIDRATSKTPRLRVQAMKNVGPRPPARVR